MALPPRGGPVFRIALAALTFVSLTNAATAQITSPGIGAPSTESRRPAPASAQLPAPGIGPPSTESRTPVARPAPAPRASTASVQLDRVVVVVNNEAVTQYDVNEQKRTILPQMRDAKVQPPAADALEKQVVERLVTERAMLQYAKESGIRVDDQMVERTILRIAQENKMTPEEFRKVLVREKVPYAKSREDIRREVTIQRIREREVDSRVSVSVAE